MGKQEESKEDKNLAERLAALEAQLAEEKEKNRLLTERKAQSNVHTEGKLPIHEMIGAPTREPIVSKLPNGTKRIDF